MRVHELAKELNTSARELMDKVNAVLKYDLKNHMSALNEDHVKSIRSLYSGPATAIKPAAPAPAKPVIQSPAPAPSGAKVSAPVIEKPAIEDKKPSTPEPAPVEAKADQDSKVLIVKPPIIVRELAELMGMKPNLLIAQLMGMNIFASINQKLELKTIQALAEKNGYTVELEKKQPKPAPAPVVVVEPEKAVTIDKETDKIQRAPVVAFMGHVDHGKTSLLDKIRNTKVAAGEDGGITQHIGAYTVNTPTGHITFLDTPGHEAFTKMRARGANLTDIVVIVIDAVDGMMPQTREAIQHAKASGVCIMVAINKIDLRAANPDRVKQQLQAEGLSPEDWGGTTVCTPVSALTGEGVNNLLDMINLQAEILELKANPKRKAQGYVIEAQMEPGMGATASLLIRKGTLHVGDAIIVGSLWGKVKALLDDQGKKVKEAGPSSAVKCLGLSGVPEAGAEFVAVDNEKVARETSEQRTSEDRAKNLAGAAPRRASLESLLQKAEASEKKELGIIIKADVQGSIEAIQHIIEGIKSTKVSVKALLTGVGSINTNDVLLASASDAIIIGFHTSAENGVTSLAKREGIEIRLYNIIYELMDDLKNVMAGLLDPILRETPHGQVEIKQVFDLGKKGKVAGCLVRSGKVTSRSRARVRRKGDVIFEGAVANLKRYQNDASEVREGQECGIRLDHFTEYEIGDVIEFYEVEKIAQQL